MNRDEQMKAILEKEADRIIEHNQRLRQREAEAIQRRVERQRSLLLRKSTGRKREEEYPVLSKRRQRTIAENELLLMDDDNGRPGLERIPAGVEVDFRAWEARA